jgi:hypothetical protein
MSLSHPLREAFNTLTLNLHAFHPQFPDIPGVAHMKR